MAVASGAGLPASLALVGLGIVDGGGETLDKSVDFATQGDDLARAFLTPVLEDQCGAAGQGVVRRSGAEEGEEDAGHDLAGELAGQQHQAAKDQPQQGEQHHPDHQPALVDGQAVDASVRDAAHFGAGARGGDEDQVLVVKVQAGALQQGGFGEVGGDGGLGGRGGI